MPELEQADGAQSEGMSWEQAKASAREHLGFDEQSSEEDEALEPTQADDTQSASEDTAPEEAAGQESDEETAETEDELLSQEDLEALRESNPEVAKLAENLTNWRAKLTQQSQTLAEQRKEVESVRPWLEALQQDPKGTLQRLAQELEVDLGTSEEPSQEQDEDLEEMARNQLRESLDDPELEFLADRFAGPLVGLAERIARQIVDQRIKPIEQNFEHSRVQEAEAQLAEAEEGFKEAHPDWEQHEPEMMRLAQKYLSGPDGKLFWPKGLDPKEFMEDLYTIASKDKAAADQAERMIQRQTQAAKKAERPKGSVSSQNIAKKPPKGASFEDALAAAKRGEKWADYGG